MTAFRSFDATWVLGRTIAPASVRHSGPIERPDGSQVQTRRPSWMAYHIPARSEGGGASPTLSNRSGPFGTLRPGSSSSPCGPTMIPGGCADRDDTGSCQSMVGAR